MKISTQRGLQAQDSHIEEEEAEEEEAEEEEEGEVVEGEERHPLLQEEETQMIGAMCNATARRSSTTCTFDVRGG